MTAQPESNKGERETGVRWSYRLTGIDAHRSDFFHGDYDTRHEAIGHAVVMARIWNGADGYEVRWHESLWREVDEPAVCTYCGFEDWYRPLVRTVHTRDGMFCCRECYARYYWQNDPDHLREFDL